MYKVHVISHVEVRVHGKGAWIPKILGDLMRPLLVSIMNYLLNVHGVYNIWEWNFAS